jgi:hypothetical protein
MSPEQEVREKKTCFVIAPVGEPDSEVRDRSDQVITHVISPAANACGYSVIRADTDERPGLIGSQIINHLIDDDLVIADLTDHNPNVFYELAIRHAVNKPVVQIIQTGQRIPFDVNQVRTIRLDYRDLNSAHTCREQIRKQIEAIERNPSEVDSPIAQAILLKQLAQSSVPEDRRDAEILGMLQSITFRLDEFDLAGRVLGYDSSDDPLSFNQELFDKVLQLAQKMIWLHRSSGVATVADPEAVEVQVWSQLRKAITNGDPLDLDSIEKIVNEAYDRASRLWQTRR